VTLIKEFENDDEYLITSCHCNLAFR
jgi:hypothetical protein